MPRSLYVLGSYDIAIARQRFQLRSNRCVFEIGCHATHRVVSGQIRQMQRDGHTAIMFLATVMTSVKDRFRALSGVCLS
jgi:hypothetical protein